MVHYNALAANQSRLLPARQKKSNESLKRKPNTFCFTLCSNWDMAKGSDACWFHGHWLSAWIFYWWPGTLKKKRVKNWWPEVLGKVCMSGHLRMHTKHDDICTPCGCPLKDNDFREASLQAAREDDTSCKCESTLFLQSLPGLLTGPQPEWPW